MLILTQNVPRTNLVTLTQRGSHLECSACDLLPVVTFRVHEARCRAPSVIITKQQHSLHISHIALNVPRNVGISLKISRHLLALSNIYRKLCDKRQVRFNC